MEKVTLSSHYQAITLPLSLSEYQTVGGACKALHKEIRILAGKLGQDPDNVMLVRPEDNDLMGHKYIPGWGICWEEGPHEWAYAENVNGKWGYAEAGYSFSLAFSKDW
mgnify:CR=1 FL=1